ncbi:MAG: CcoQ/FixQ family Cbb3-type cytochrome c oxidase assembly chaperone [Acidobacteriota bacterium]
MYQEFYANSHLLVLPVIALSLFVAAFIAILYWVFVHLRDSSVPDYMANLPLTDGPVVDDGSSEASRNE